MKRDGYSEVFKSKGYSKRETLAIGKALSESCLPINPNKLPHRSSIPGRTLVAEAFWLQEDARMMREYTTRK